MKTSENLSAILNLAVCLENFIDNTEDEIDFLKAHLEDENSEHDYEVDILAKESIRIHNKSIEIAKQFLFELEN